MHDGDELCLELGLHIMSNMFYCGGNGVVSGEQGVHNDTEAFYLEVGFVQGFKGAAIIKVMVKQHGKMGVSDGGNKSGVFGGGGEQVEPVAADRDVNRQDHGDLYSMER